MLRAVKGQQVPVPAPCLDRMQDRDRDGAGASHPVESPGGSLQIGGHWESFRVSCLACSGTGKLLHPGSTHLVQPAQIWLFLGLFQRGQGGMKEPPK